MTNIISNDVRVSPIEYVTKYSLNRNFLKLVRNDEALCAEIDLKLENDKVHSYIPMKVYNKGECVFYKTTKESQSLYLLCSEIDENSNDPAIYINSIGEKVVSNDNFWKIVGIPEGIEINPRDYALEYILSNKNDFISAHQENIALSAHPTGKLGINESTVAFTSFENIESNRSTFFYPNQIATLNPDNSIIAGYMRKWENGILEYDILFRVGSAGEINDEGLNLISANNLIVYHRNNNNLYFRDEKDFKIFNQGEDHFVTVNNTKQVNLNTNLNAYYGEVKFPEPFKDLNYMIFTSNVKNIDTESYDLKDEPIKGTYDDRLIIEGLTLHGYKESAEWEKELILPSKIKNIGKSALSWIKETNEMEVKITMLSSYDLINIEEYAFEGSDLQSIVIPKNVRCIGEFAFCNCQKLQTVDFYINTDKSKQPIVDFNVFNRCDNLIEVNFHYFSDPPLMTVSKDKRDIVYQNQLDLSAKFNDPDIRQLYGIKNNILVHTDIVESYSVPIPFLMTVNSQTLGKENDETDNEVIYTTINAEDFINKIKGNNINDKIDNKNIKPLRTFSIQNDKGIIINCNDISSQICSFTSIDTIDIIGNINDNIISGDKVDMLKIKDFSNLNLSNIFINNIQSCFISPLNSEMHYNQYSMSNLSAKYLEIDMTNSFIEASALVGSVFDTIYLKNFDNAYIKPLINRKGFGKDSFIDCQIKQLSIDSNLSYDDLKNELSLMLISDNDLNIPSLIDNCKVNGNMMKVKSGLLGASPTSDYLYINDYAMISCKWEKIKKDFVDKGLPIEITVPNEVTSINVSAFIRGIYRYSDYSPIEKITLPNTIQIIDDYAFAKNYYLQTLIFNAINPILNKIGYNAFKDCKSLNVININ